MTEGDPRLARQYVLLDPSDCDPPHSLDLSPGSRDTRKVEWLEDEFRRNGFDPEEPALVGYVLDGRVQLLTGTHRHESARRAGTKLPTTLYLRSTIEAHWGKETWVDVVKDISVLDLEKFPVREDVTPPTLEERVDLTRDLSR